AVEELADAAEVGAQRLALLPGELAIRLRPLLAIVQQRVDPSRGIDRSRRLARIEIEVQADRAAFLGAKRGELSEPVPADSCRHVASLAGKRRFYAACASSPSATDGARPKS